MDKKDEEKSNFIKNEIGNFKIKIGTVGNFILVAFIIIILATAGLIYFLIHNEKERYDKEYDMLVSGLNTLKDENTSDVQTIANIIDSAISDTNTNTVVTKDTVNTLMNEKLVVLYNGLILDTTKMDEVKLQYIDSSVAESDKYVITYYSYQNYSFKESKLGTLSNKVYGNLVKIDNVGKVAISEDYNAIPRNIKVINSLPEAISADTTNYDTIKTIIVDLDGNSTEEYVLVLANKETGYSKITLFDSKGNKISDLASVEKSKWKKGNNSEYYLSISNVEIVDIDNDGIMEILLEIPHASGDPTISLLKYNSGKLDGKTNIECSLLSE